MTYMVEQGYFSVELRIALAAVCGMVMVGFGLRLRAGKPVYALIMQGGGIGVLYLSAFAAAKFSTLLPPAAALAVMTLLLVPAVALAIIQHAEIMAVFSFLGGYAAPLLLSSGSGDYVALFSYYALLNAALPGICRFRFWRRLNLLGAVCTFVVMGSWLAHSYLPEMFFRVEPFLLGFAAIFVLLTFISVRKREFSFRRPADAVPALSIPFLAVFFQWRIAKDLPHGLSLSALSFGIIFLALAALVWKRWGTDLRRLAEFYLVSGVVLVNLALPLEVAGSLSSAVWAVEGAVFFYFACRLNSVRLKTAGLVIQAAALVLFLKESTSFGPADHTLPGTCMLALSALASGFFQKTMSAQPTSLAPADHTLPETCMPALSAPASGFFRKTASGPNPRNKEGGTSKTPTVPFEAMKLDHLAAVCGLVYWYAGLAAESWRFADDPLMTFFLASGVSATLFFLLGRFLKYADLFAANLPTVILSLAALFSSLWISQSVYFQFEMTNLLRLPLTHQFLSGTEGLAWSVFAFSQAVFFITARNKAPATVSSWWATITTLELLLVVTSACRALALDMGLARAWIGFGGTLPSLLYIFVLLLPLMQRRMGCRWGMVFFGRVPVVMFAGLAAWFVAGMLRTGSPAPLPVYIPLLNPLELRQALSIALFLVWQKKLRDIILTPPVIPWRFIVIGLDLLVFVWLHSIIVRTAHFYTGMPMSEVWNTDMFQIMLTALWGLYGMAHIINGNRLGIRILWIAGAALVSLDTAKLLLLDLADKGTLMRVVSFFTVGGIFLLIGFLAPLPPRQKTGNEDEEPQAPAGAGSENGLLKSVSTRIRLRPQGAGRESPKGEVSDHKGIYDE
jgi:uncharacterized membrane protein